MAKQKKLSPAQKFKRRLAASQRKQSLPPVPVADIIEIDDSGEHEMTTFKLSSAVQAKRKISHKKARSKEYWNRIKIIKKQRLAIQRLIVGSVCNQTKQQLNVSSCCCHCACPSSVASAATVTNTAAAIGKSLNNGEKFSTRHRQRCGSTHLNFNELDWEELNHNKVHKMRTITR